MAQGSSDALLQRELLDTIKELRAMIEEQRKELAASRQREKLLQEQIEVMNRRFFGRSSEKHMVRSEGQMDFFNEVEMEADRQAGQEEDASPEEAQADGDEKASKKRKSRTPRKELFHGLPVEEEIIDLPEEEKTCKKCGTTLEVVGKRIVRETLKYIPARLTVVRTAANVYGCPQCRQTEDKANIVSAQVPEALIPHSYASETVLAHAIYQKFVNAVPLYRQEKDWEQMGMNLSRGTLGRWIRICSETYFNPIYAYLHRLLLGRQFAMADETTVQVLKEPSRSPGTESYMWLFRSGEDGLPPLILYRYTETRAGFNAAEFLKGYKGYLMTDGYQGYNKVSGIEKEACWAHIRRKFCDAVPNGRKDDLSEPAVQGVLYCDKLFAIERYCRENGYDHEKRHEYRNKKAPKVLEAFWSWLDQQHPTEGSRMYKAVIYAQNRKPYAETYLQDGRCSFSNNPSENSIRPFTVGRKNWLFCDTPGGAQASATVYTMVEMAKAHGLNVEKYLAFLLERRPHTGMKDEDFEKLVPWSNEARASCDYAQQIACM